MTEPSNLGQHQASSSDHLYSASAHAWNPSGILPGELHTSPHESLSNPRDVSATVETNEVLPQSQWAVLNMENYALQQTLLMRRTKEEENCDGSALHLLLRTLSQGGFQLPMGDRSYGGQEEAVLGDHMMRGVRGSYSLVLPSETISGPALPLRSPSASGGPLTRAETSPGFGWPTIGEGPDGRDKVYEKHVVGAIEKDVEFGEINILLINWETCSVYTY